MVAMGGLSYQGLWDADTNTPTIVSGVGSNGQYYIVSVAGTTNIDGISDWGVRDWIIFDGTAWQKIDNSDIQIPPNGAVAISNGTDLIGDPNGFNYDFSSNRVGIGIPLGSSASPLSVGTGAGTQFGVEFDGNISLIKGVPYVWPSADAAGQLTSDGAGNLTWSPSGGGVTGSGATNAIAVWSSPTNVSYDAQFEYLTASLKQNMTQGGTSLIPNTNSWFEGTRSVNGAAQFNIRNSSNGTSASAGFIITGDNGTDSTNFTEFGRNSSTYNVAAQNFVAANAGYILQDFGDFGIAVANGTFYINAGGTTTTQRRFSIGAQNTINTNSGYVNTWTNSTNSTWGSESMSNSAATRTVNLISDSVGITGGGAQGTGWYGRSNTFNYTPGANVTAGSWKSEATASTYTIGARVVTLTDIIANTISSSVVNITNGGNLTVGGAIINQLLTQAYSVGGTAIDGQLNFINQYIANTGAMPSSLYKSISLYVSSTPGTSPTFPGTIPNESQWGVVSDAQRSWFKALMIGDIAPTLEGVTARAAMRVTTAQSKASKTVTTATYTYGMYTDNVVYFNATSNNQVVTLVSAANPNTIEDGLRVPVMKIDGTANTVTVQVDGATAYIWGPTLVGKVATVVLSTQYAGGTFICSTHVDGTQGWLYLPGVL